MSNLSLINPGVSINFDGQALQTEEEAEYRKEEEQQQHELRQLLTNFDDLLEDDILSVSSSEPGSQNVSFCQDSADSGRPTLRRKTASLTPSDQSSLAGSKGTQSTLTPGQLDSSAEQRQGQRAGYQSDKYNPAGVVVSQGHQFQGHQFQGHDLHSGQHGLFQEEGRGHRGQGHFGLGHIYARSMENLSTGNLLGGDDTFQSPWQHDGIATSQGQGTLGQGLTSLQGTWAGHAHHQDDDLQGQGFHGNHLQAARHGWGGSSEALDRPVLEHRHVCQRLLMMPSDPGGEALNFHTASSAEHHVPSSQGYQHYQQEDYLYRHQHYLPSYANDGNFGQGHEGQGHRYAGQGDTYQGQGHGVAVFGEREEAEGGNDGFRGAMHGHFNSDSVAMTTTTTETTPRSQQPDAQMHTPSVAGSVPNSFPVTPAQYANYQGHQADSEGYTSLPNDNRRHRPRDLREDANANARGGDRQEGVASSGNSEFSGPYRVLYRGREAEHSQEGERHGEKTEEQREEELFLKQGGASDGERQLAQLQVLYGARGRKLEELGASLESVKEELGRQNRALKHQLSLATAEKEGLQTSLKSSQELLQEAKDSNAQLQGRLRALETQVSSLKEGKEELLKKLESAEVTIETLSEQLGELQNGESLSRARHQHENIVSSLQQKHAEEILVLKQKLDSASETIAAQQGELGELRRQLEAKVKAMEDAQVSRADTVNRLTHSLEDSQRQCQNLLQSAAAQEVTKLKVQLQQTAAGKRMSEDMCCTLQSEVKELKEQLGMFETASSLGVFSHSHTPSRYHDDSMADLGIRKTLDFDLSGQSETQSDAARKSVRFDGSQSPEELVTSLRVEMERCLASNREKRAEVTKLREQLHASSGKTECLTLDLQDSKKQLEEQKRRIAELESLLGPGERVSATETRLRRDLEAIQKERSLQQQEIQELARRLEEVGASEARLTEINQELRQQLQQMVKDGDEDKRTALERQERILQQVHEETRHNLEEQLKSEFTQEKGALVQRHEEQQEQLRSELSRLERELDEIKALYVTTCQEARQLEASWLAKSQTQLSALREELEREKEEEMERVRRELEEAHQSTRTQLQESLARELQQEQQQTLELELARARETWVKEQEAATRVAVDAAVEAAERDWQIHLEAEVDRAVEKAVAEAKAAAQTELEEKQDRRLEEERRKMKEELDRERKAAEEEEEEDRRKRAEEVEEAHKKEEELRDKLEAAEKQLAELEARISSQVQEAVEQARQTWHRDHERTVKALTQTSQEVSQQLFVEEIGTLRGEADRLSAELARKEEEWRQERQKILQQKDVERKAAVAEVREQCQQDYQSFIAEHKDTLNNALKAARERYVTEQREAQELRERELQTLKQQEQQLVQKSQQLQSQLETALEEKARSVEASERHEKRGRALQREREKLRREVERREQLLQQADTHMAQEVQRLRSDMEAAFQQRLQSEAVRGRGSCLQCGEMEERLQEVQTEHAQTQTHMEAERKSLAQQLHSAQSKVEELEEHIQELSPLEGEVAGLQTRCQQLQTQLREGRRALAEQEACVERLRERLAALEEEGSTTQSQLSLELHSAKAALSQAQEELQAEATRHQQELARQRAALEERLRSAEQRSQQSLAELQEAHTVAMATVQQQHSSERKELLARVRDSASRQHCSRASQTENFEEKQLLELRNRYLDTVSKIKNDVMQHVTQTNLRAAELVKVEVRRERHTTLVHLKKIYQANVRRILEAELKGAELRDSISAIDRALEALSVSLSCSSRSESPLSDVGRKPDAQAAEKSVSTHMARGKSHGVDMDVYFSEEQDTEAPLKFTSGYLSKTEFFPLPSDDSLSNFGDEKAPGEEIALPGSQPHPAVKGRQAVALQGQKTMEEQAGRHGDQKMRPVAHSNLESAKQQMSGSQGKGGQVAHNNQRSHLGSHGNRGGSLAAPGNQGTLPVANGNVTEPATPQRRGHQGKTTASDEKSPGSPGQSQGGGGGRHALLERYRHLPDKAVLPANRRHSHGPAASAPLHHDQARQLMQKTLSGSQLTLNQEGLVSTSHQPALPERHREELRGSAVLRSGTTQVPGGTASHGVDDVDRTPQRIGSAGNSAASSQQEYFGDWKQSPIKGVTQRRQNQEQSHRQFQKLVSDPELRGRSRAVNTVVSPDRTEGSDGEVTRDGVGSGVGSRVTDEGKGRRGEFPVTGLGLYGDEGNLRLTRVQRDFSSPRGSGSSQGTGGSSGGRSGRSGVSSLSQGSAHLSSGGHREVQDQRLSQTHGKVSAANSSQAFPSNGDRRMSYDPIGTGRKYGGWDSGQNSAAKYASTGNLNHLDSSSHTRSSSKKFTPPSKDTPSAVPGLEYRDDLAADLASYTEPMAPRMASKSHHGLQESFADAYFRTPQVHLSSELQRPAQSGLPQLAKNARLSQEGVFENAALQGGAGAQQPPNHENIGPAGGNAGQMAQGSDGMGNPTRSRSPRKQAAGVEFSQCCYSEDNLESPHFASLRPEDSSHLSFEVCQSFDPACQAFQPGQRRGLDSLTPALLPRQLFTHSTLSKATSELTLTHIPDTDPVRVLDPLVTSTPGVKVNYRYTPLRQSLKPMSPSTSLLSTYSLSEGDLRYQVNADEPILANLRPPSQVKHLPILEGGETPVDSPREVSQDFGSMAQDSSV